MLRRKDLYEEFVKWARDLKHSGKQQNYEATTAITPYTGQICDKCLAKTGKLKRTRKQGLPYHAFKCVECRTEGDRHQVSARVSALILKQYIEADTITGS